MKFEVNTRLWERFAPLVKKAQMPSRYLGQEYGAVEPADKPNADYHAVMIYPDTYEIGQANQAIAILYDSLNSDEHIYCERAYLPWVDMIEMMRERDLPLASLETFTPLADFDFIGITLPHELCATNVLEVLDLGGIALHADKRGKDAPLVFAGGPCTYNPEPFAAFFDAFFIGEGEKMDLEVALLHRTLKTQGASRTDILREIARVDGLYVPSLYEASWHEVAVPAAGDPAPAPAGDDLAPVPVFTQRYTTVRPREDDVPAVVAKRVMGDFDATDALPRPIVPYGSLVHDRLSVEILRGCARGCRFCQAGMVYRPVRERSADSIVAATMAGLACTGYDEVSLTSLSSTDYSRIMELLRRLKRRLAGTGRGVSLPSQRVDAFGTELAALVAGEKKPSLTLAPEAGTQRMRDVINKGVTEDDLFAAIENAFSLGWQRMKFYFMIGLPFERDEDILAIGDLCRRALAVAKEAVPEKQRPRTNVKLSASVALFVPKPVTPFQWEGIVSREEMARRIEVLKAGFPKRGIDLHWHDSQATYVEAAMARGGRECADLIERAWERSARFDAWSDQFDFDAWEQAGADVGLDVEACAGRTFAFDEPLPWDHISAGVAKSFLKREYDKARAQETTPDCSFGPCAGCGVCPGLGVANDLQGARR